MAKFWWHFEMTKNEVKKWNKDHFGYLRASIFSLRSSISAALKYRTIFLLWCTVFRVAQQTHQPVRFWNYTLLTNSGGEGKSAADAVGIYRLWSDADLTVLIARRRRLQNSLAQRRCAHIMCACFLCIVCIALLFGQSMQTQTLKPTRKENKYTTRCRRWHITQGLEVFAAGAGAGRLDWLRCGAERSLSLGAEKSAGLRYSALFPSAPLLSDLRLRQEEFACVRKRQHHKNVSRNMYLTNLNMKLSRREKVQ
jgi:hypothetical protein